MIFLRAYDDVVDYIILELEIRPVQWSSRYKVFRSRKVRRDLNEIVDNDNGGRILFFIVS